MDIVIKEVKDDRQLKAFINFPYRLYRNHKYYVPQLRSDIADTLNRKKTRHLSIVKQDTGLLIKKGK